MGCCNSRAFPSARRSLHDEPGREALLVGSLWKQESALICSRRDVLLVENELRYGDKRVRLDDIEAITTTVKVYEIQLKLKPDKAEKGENPLRFRAATMAEFQVWLKAISLAKDKLGKLDRTKGEMSAALRRAKTTKQMEIHSKSLSGFWT